MKRKLHISPFVILCVLALSVVIPTKSNAQENTTQTSITTWKGADVNNLIKDSKDAAASYPFFLYNVGTGKFIMAGGGWGIEAMLTLQDYGVPFTVFKQTVTPASASGMSATEVTTIASGVSTNAEAYALGCNAQGWTAGTSNSQVMNALLDARPTSSFTSNGTVYYTRSWTFERVEDASNTASYTYRLKETINRSSGSPTQGDFYLGAVTGNNAGTHDENRTSYMTSVINGYTEITDNPNYQWRFITTDEFNEVQTTTDANAFGGLNANVTDLLSDPYFDRNQTAFSSAWTVKTKEMEISNNEARADWTGKGNKLYDSSSFTRTDASVTHTNGGNQSWLWLEPWDAAVFRKLQPNDWNDNAYQMANAQYEMATFEGKGSAYQTISVPQSGQYQLQVLGYSSDSAAPGYLFVANEDGTDVKRIALPTLQEEQTLYSQGNALNEVISYDVVVDAKTNWVNAAKYLDNNVNLYTVSIIFSATSANQKFRVGIMKDEAKKSFQAWDATEQTGEKLYYKYFFDAAYAAVDNFQLFYLGTEPPFILNENKTKDDYIKNETSKTNRTVYLKRGLASGKWQSITLPVSISTNVFRQAFGEDARLGVLEGVGKSDTQSPTSIDFKAVSLSPNQTAIEAGRYYLIYATRDAENVEYTVDNVAQGGKFYKLGRLNLPETLPEQYPFTQTVENSAWNTDDREPFTGGEKNLVANGTYIKLRKTASSDGTVAANPIPAGAYYVLNGNMYHLTQSQATTGFQWWITTQGNAAKNGLKIDFADLENTTTYIDGISIDKNDRSRTSAVYNLSGQKVADSAAELGSLPKGIYITGGRKIINR